jgi:cytoskeletal protein RodZ
MTSVGETLRRARENRNLELEQVSRELKIATRFLEAIEREQFERLPGGVFAKSFVRQYARMLDLDEDEAAAEVQRLLTPPSAPQLAGLGETRATAPQHVEFAPRVRSISNRRFGSESWLPALALVVAVMLGCSLVYGWWQHDHRPVSAASPASPASSKTELAQTQNAAPTPVSANPAEEAPAQSEPVKAAPAASVAPVADAPPLKASGAVKVEITTSDEPVWVLARTDGKYAFSGTLEANQTRTVEADGIVLLRIGNAGGVAITVNGKPIPAVGPKGQVRTVQLTSGGFQIVAPPKPSVAPDGLL